MSLGDNTQFWRPGERRQNINISPQELEALCESAAERGASKALAKVGLHDVHAGRDVHELRSILTVYRDARSSIVKTLLKGFTTMVLVVIILVTSLRYFR